MLKSGTRQYYTFERLFLVFVDIDIDADIYVMEYLD